MRCASRNLVAASLTLMLPITGTAQVSDSSGTRANAAGAEVLDSIVVTSSKRSERLQDTPTSSSVLSAEKLENLNVQGFAGYAGLVPNLNQAASSAPGFGTIIIRGFYTGPQQTTNTTAFYIGESPFSANGAFAFGSVITPDPDLIDVARIEVLKGPQGTLFGANGLGGLIRVIPLPPSTDLFSGSLRVGASKTSGGGGGGNGRFSLNIPIQEGVLGLQVSGFDRHEGGFTTNVRTDTHDLGALQSKGGSVTALLTPTKDLQFTLRGLSQSLRSDGPWTQDEKLGTGTPAYGEHEISSFFNPTTKSNYQLVELTGQYETDVGTLTGTASHGKYNVRTQQDYSSYASLFQAAFCRTFPASCLPTPDYNGLTNLNPRLSKKSGEVRFASKRLGPIEFLVGGFATREDSTYFIDIQGRNSQLVAAPPPYDNIIASTNIGSYRERAGFGDVTYYLTDDIDVTGGLRYAKNKQNFHLSSTGLLGRASQNIASEDSATTYQATARWRPTRELSFYGRFATGYRPGGPQNNPAAPNPTFAPDKVKNYELGLKGSALDHQLTFDAAVYHVDWINIQLNALLNGIVIVGNAGKANVDGFESQATYNHPSGVSVGGSFGYNRSILKEVGGTTAAYIGAAPGDQLPGSPRVTAALFADYRFPLVAGVEGDLGATVRYQGSKHAGYSLPGVVSPDYLIPSYTTLDLRAIARWDKYTLRAGVDNVTNKDGLSGYSTLRVTASQVVNSTAYVIRPRFYYATLGYDF